MTSSSQKWADNVKVAEKKPSLKYVLSKNKVQLGSQTGVCNARGTLKRGYCYRLLLQSRDLMEQLKFRTVVRSIGLLGIKRRLFQNELYFKDFRSS